LATRITEHAMIEVCKNCHTAVLSPMTDGRCPACLKPYVVERVPKGPRINPLAAEQAVLDQAIRRSGTRSIWVGIVLLIVGLTLTGFTALDFLGTGGGRVIFWYGAIGVGIFKIIDGFYRRRKH
jgi:hypothetical protein